jgi:2-succinyl-5-enolpyruvyl-6-hydroxy-3-cyclohexene-1-carboxylate synthase
MSESNLLYTNERNVQIVIALLKAHGIHRVIASPGTTNMTFVVSIQNDPWFHVWSSVDERSAAYMACGIASETGEPVVLSCTGATASRNYMPGLTEAYYRKLPVLAITSTRGNHRIGHLVDQQIDRRSIPNDIAVESVTIPMVKDKSDERFCEIEANKALLALKLNGGGPAHINLYTGYSKDFTVKEISKVNVIYRHTAFDEALPDIPKEGRVAVFIGAHQKCSEKLTSLIDCFCATHDAVVFCDHTSGYRGKYEIHPQLLFGQKKYNSDFKKINLCIHIGEVSGSQYQFRANHVWRVSQDGQLRDTWGNLRRVFAMPEEVFFEKYSNKECTHTEYLDELNKEISILRESIPTLPFGNLWIAQNMVDKLPLNCELHLGIYNSLRSWNFFKLPKGVYSKCNVGGFGIDGGLSTMIGASLVKPEKLFVGVFGDLAFFYDMNVIGNRHVGNNIRLIIINNGKGAEFRNYDHPCFFLGSEAEEYVAAAGHYGNKSEKLIRHYAEDLGYEYFSVKNEKDFFSCVDDFLDTKKTNHPKIMEVFTESNNESEALRVILNMASDNACFFEKAKSAVKNILGSSAKDIIKHTLK